MNADQFIPITARKKRQCIAALLFNIYGLISLILLINISPVKSQGISPPTTTSTTPSPFNNGVCSIPTLNPCVPVATCTPSLPVFGEALCICPQGYGGDGKREDVGGLGCYDIDECLSGTHTCDSNSERCINYNGGYDCYCAPGYQMDASDVACVDIDECVTGSNVCPLDETMCFNVPSSYECVCRLEGKIYDYDLGACRDINKCTDLGGSMNPCSQLCEIVESTNEPICSCYAGYILNSDQGTCDDVDECISGDNSCDQNGIISRCVNTVGSYRCECNHVMGYSNSPDGRSCINLNECITDATVCGTGAMCCMDLDPPQRYMCLVPGDVVKTNQQIETYDNYFQVLQRESRKDLHSEQENVNLPNDLQLNSLFPAQSYTRSSDPIRQSTISARYIVENNCFQFETMYMDKDIELPVENVPYTSSCQNICSAHPNCIFYSYNIMTQECHLKATSFTPYFDSNYVSGTGDCSYSNLFREKEEKGLFSFGLTALEPLQQRTGGGLLGRFLENDHFVTHVIREGVLPPEMCGVKQGSYKHCIVAGILQSNEIESINRANYSSLYSLVTVDNEHLVIRPVKNFKEVEKPYIIRGMDADTSSETGSKRSLMVLGLDFGMNKILGEKGLKLYSDNLGVLDSLLPINLFSPQCPEGFVYSPDVARELRKDKTLELARSFFVTETNGTTQAKDPADLKESLVSNTNYLANELARWYIELASAPVDIASAAFSSYPINTYANGTDGLILTQDSLPGGIQPAASGEVSDERKKLNSALLTTLGFLSILGGASPGAGLTRNNGRNMAF